MKLEKGNEPMIPVTTLDNLNFIKSFSMKTNTSSFRLGAILSQKDHHIA